MRAYSQPTRSRNERSFPGAQTSPPPPPPPPIRLLLRGLPEKFSAPATRLEITPGLRAQRNVGRQRPQTAEIAGRATGSGHKRFATLGTMLYLCAANTLAWRRGVRSQMSAPIPDKWSTAPKCLFLCARSHAKCITSTFAHTHTCARRHTHVFIIFRRH